MKKALLLFICVFSIISCTKKQYGFPEQFASEISNNEPSSYKFIILDYDTVAPIIEYTANNQIFYMAIDTGSSTNVLLRPKLDSLVSADIMKNAEQYDPYTTERLTINFDEESLLYTIDPLGKFSTGKKYNYFDGFLGQEYLMQFNNVVFDYVNNKFSVNQQPICEKSLPMYKHKEYNIFLTDVTINEEKARAIIDTGNKFNFFNKTKNQSTNYNKEKAVSLQIGDINYENIIIGHTGKLITNKKALEIIANENIIGYPCFKDHIIQFDYEHNVFRIK